MYPQKLGEEMDDLVVVGAVDNNGELWEKSNRAPAGAKDYVQYYAPGVGINFVGREGNEIQGDGTSYGMGHLLDCSVPSSPKLLAAIQTTAMFAYLRAADPKYASMVPDDIPGILKADLTRYSWPRKNGGKNVIYNNIGTVEQSQCGPPGKRSIRERQNSDPSGASVESCSLETSSSTAMSSSSASLSTTSSTSSSIAQSTTDTLMTNPSTTMSSTPNSGTIMISSSTVSASGIISSTSNSPPQGPDPSSASGDSSSQPTPTPPPPSGDYIFTSTKGPEPGDENTTLFGCTATTTTFDPVITFCSGTPTPISTIMAPVPSDSCGVKYHYYWDSFNIQGSYFDPDKLGKDGSGLKKQIKGCGALTKWSFNLTPSNPDYQWSASGNLPIGARSCIGNAVISAGGTSKDKCKGGG